MLMEEFLGSYREKSIEFLQSMGMRESWAVILQSVLVVIAILIFAWLVDKLATILMRKYVPKFVGKSKNKWDDIFMENKVFAQISHFLPGVVMALLYPLVASQGVRLFIHNLFDTYFIIVALLFANALINALSGIYATYKGEGAANIKIYLQVIKVLLFSLGGIAIISIFANKNFVDMLTAMGAMVTILLIVYKDTILGFVAGVQLSANKMLKVGDWISLPSSNADGTVIDIGLNTVKVQNWDKTITTIPTYSLISAPFTNWRGMEESGGRRVKRSVNIDIESIHFLSSDEIDKFEKIKLIEKYISDKVAQIKKHNEGIEECFNQRRLTNIGTFRAYVENYLRQLGVANLHMTFLVRQLQSTEKGVPIEIYLFLRNKEWAIYESIQADIFDHIFAMVPEFNLRIFQNPTGHNFSKFISQ